VNAEASTVLRAVAADFFFNCWCLEIPSDNRIRHVPRCVHYLVLSFPLVAFWDFYVGSGSRTPQLYSVSYSISSGLMVRTNKKVKVKLRMSYPPPDTACSQRPECLQCGFLHFTAQPFSSGTPYLNILKCEMRNKHKFSQYCR
jgi:hypothetical protein